MRKQHRPQKQEDKLISAAAYLLMSDDDQEKSIAAQRAEVRRYAKEEGYKIIAEYVDEGLSASKEEVVRESFQRMISDAPKAEWQAVLCWDFSRFSRLDSIDGGTPEKILRGNDIILDTIKEGRFDFNTEEGRMKRFMVTEFAARYSRSLARDVIRGRILALLAGSWPHGNIPYGYDRLFVNGGEQLHVARRQKFRKPKNWRLILVESSEGETVKFIFDQYINFDVSLRGIAIKLNAEGIPGPNGARWNKGTVGTILRNPAYKGLATIGDDHVRRGYKTFHSAESTTQTGIVPALVSEELWHAAQLKLAKNISHPHTGKSSALSGILKCGHCGWALSKVGDKYRCPSSSRGRLTGCHQWVVKEKEILPIVCKRLAQEVEEQILQEMDARPPDKVSTDLEMLEKHVENMRGKVAEAGRTFLLRPDLQASLEGPLKQLQEELKNVEERLAIRKNIASQPDDGEDFRKWLKGIRDQLIHIPAVWSEPQYVPEAERTVGTRVKEGADLTPEALRAFLKRYNVSVVCTWRRLPKPIGRKQFELDKVDVQVMYSSAARNDTGD